MKKILAILLVLMFAFSLVACGEEKAPVDDTNTGGDSSVTTTSDETSSKDIAEVSSDVSSMKNEAPSSSSKPTSSKPKTSSKPITPTKLNPKTNLKIGKYEAKYVDGNTYVVCVLEYGKNFDDDTLLLNKCVYYNKQGATDRLNSMGMTFSEEDYNKITVGGVVYFDLEELSWTIIPEAIKLTETTVKISGDYENWTEFTLLPNYSLKQENEPNKSYAKAGTIFTYKG